MIAAAGVLSLVAGTLVLTHEPAVVAEPFGPTTTAGPLRTVLLPDDTTGPVERAAPPAPRATAVHTGQATTARKPPAAPPGQLSFTDAGVLTEVVPVGVLTSGALQIPEDPARIGWWAAGAMPGQPEGSLVLAGHMDGLNHGGAMSILLDIEAGDSVAIQDRRGGTHRYRVVARSIQPRESIDPSLFTTDGPHRLVLITCGGTYDRQAGQYSDNIVVTAQPVRSG